MLTESTSALRAADFGNRFSAFVIDTALLFALQWIVFMVASRQLQAVGMASTEACSVDSAVLCQGPSTLLWAILLVFLLFSTVGYYAYFDGVLGATPGKRWMGLQVVDGRGESPIGLIAGVLRALIRQAFWLSLFFVLAPSPLSVDLPAAVFLIVPAAALVPVVWAAFDPAGLGLHDRIAATMVVSAELVRTRPASTRNEFAAAESPLIDSSEESS